MKYYYAAYTDILSKRLRRATNSRLTARPYDIVKTRSSLNL